MEEVLDRKSQWYLWDTRIHEMIHHWEYSGNMELIVKGITGSPIDREGWGVLRKAIMTPLKPSDISFTSKDSFDDVINGTVYIEFRLTFDMSNLMLERLPDGTPISDVSDLLTLYPKLTNNKISNLQRFLWEELDNEFDPDRRFKEIVQGI